MGSVTLVLPASPSSAEQTQTRTKTAPTVRVRVCSRLGVAALLVATGVLYLWNLSASGWANSFYS
ncbi:MAG TPA: hypothetical protein VJR50_18510, partial [Mycobacterium sp.]|nr:hypothetical protein [Mycobacterium sp.]